ncbi:MAG: hypothetical protein IPK60_03665 [Sandaracinaceae bacterium]|nr:hypothetical protein [Sandaracinaceae bacterium]
MTRLSFHFLAIALLALALSSCSSASPAPAETAELSVSTGGDTPAAQRASESTDIPAIPENVESPPQAWESLTPQEKGHWMAEHVMPTMGALFREYDATRYAEFSCATCHGAAARQTHNFTMPSASLPVLPGPTSPQWQTPQPEHERVMRFMGGPVEHTMARLLGKEPFNMQTMAGFGCYGCHTHN